MKIIILSMVVMAFTSLSYADGVLKVKSKNFTCAELNELVQEEGTVLIKGFGSLLVHSSPNECYFGQEAYKSGWRTIDKFSCVAGYSCRKKSDNDR